MVKKKMTKNDNVYPTSENLINYETDIDTKRLRHLTSVMTINLRFGYDAT